MSMFDLRSINRIESSAKLGLIVCRLCELSRAFRGVDLTDLLNDIDNVLTRHEDTLQKLVDRRAL